MNQPPGNHAPALADEPVTAYPRGGSGASAREIADLCRSIPEWSLVERQDIRKLERIFHVPDFRAALAFAQQVGDLAESSGHHPSITIEWGRVTVTWWTLRMRGLHRNDFVMAARSDRLWDAWMWEPELDPNRARPR